MRRCAGPLLAGLVLVAGCGEAPAPGPAATDSRGGGEPTTPRALAAVAAEYVGEPSSASEEESDLSFDEGAVGAGLRFGSDGEYDGDLLSVVVGTGQPMSQFACDDPDVQDLAGCEQLDGGTFLTTSQAALDAGEALNFWRD